LSDEEKIEDENGNASISLITSTPKNARELLDDHERKYEKRVWNA